MKKLFAAIIAMGLTVSVSTMTASATDMDNLDTLISFTPKAPEDFSTNYDALLLHGNGEEDAITVYSSIIVTVSSPCDEEWRAKYPNSWMFEANRAIEDADELMRSEFNIDLRSISQYSWDSDDNADPNTSELLTEAWNEWGTSGQSLMIAFSAQNSYWGGWGYIGNSGCIIFDQEYEANCCVVRHEVGHNYNCLDHYNDNPPYPYSCVMNNSYTQYNDLCPTCYSTWSNNRYLH